MSIQNPQKEMLNWIHVTTTRWLRKSHIFCRILHELANLFHKFLNLPTLPLHKVFLVTWMLSMEQNDVRDGGCRKVKVGWCVGDLMLLGGDGFCFYSVLHQYKKTWIHIMPAPSTYILMCREVQDEFNNDTYYASSDPVRKCSAFSRHFVHGRFRFAEHFSKVTQRLSHRGGWDP